MNWRYSLCFSPLKETVQNWCHFLLRCLVEFTSDPSWVSCFLVWKVISYWFKFFNRCRSLWVIYSCVSFGSLSFSFKGLVHFTWIIKFVVVELFIVFLWHPFNFHGVCTGDLSPMSVFPITLNCSIPSRLNIRIRRVCVHPQRTSKCFEIPKQIRKWSLLYPPLHS